MNASPCIIHCILLLEYSKKKGKHKIEVVKNIYIYFFTINGIMIIFLLLNKKITSIGND